MFVLLAGTIGTTWGLIRALSAEDKATKLLAQTQKSNDILTDIFTDLDINSLQPDDEPLKIVFAQRLKLHHRR